MVANDPQHVFGEIAETYDATRPGYPQDAIRDLIDLSGVDAGSRVLEVGCGTGKATRLLAPSGFSLACLDPADGMLAVARRTCQSFGNVRFIATTLEQFDSMDRFDLIFSAQAFHWVDPAVGFSKVASLLKPGGALALLWNSPRRNPGSLSDAINRAYAEHAPDIVAASIGLTRRGSPDAITKTGRYGEVEIREYQWSLTYSKEEWIRLLGTHSDHRILDVNIRERLFPAIGRAIDDHGGTVDEAIVTTLQFARARN